MFRFERDPRKKHLLFIEGEEGEQGGGVVTEEGSEEAQQSEQEHGEKQRSNHVPYERFSSVIKQKQDLERTVEAYKKFGSVEELAKQIARSKEISGSKRFTESEIKALEEDLRQVPAIKQMLEYVESQTAERTEISKQFINDAASKVSSLVKELGFDLKDPKDRQLLEYDIQAVIAERIKQTPGWLARWKRNDMSVVTEAWNKVKGIYGWTRRSQNADRQANKLQPGSRMVSNGAAPQGGGDKGPPKTADGRLDERAILAAASDRAFARLKASEE